MANLDPRIEIIREKYGLDKADFWELPQKKGTWLVKHAALELAAAQADIRFDMPTIIEADSAGGIAAVAVQGQMGDRFEWSIGECSPKNNKNAYPWAMAEKRGKDRVILKLIGIHGLVYSEDEMSDAGDIRPPRQDAPVGGGAAPGQFATPESKAKARDLSGEVIDALREAGNKGRAALRAYWESEEFQTVWETLPKDWRAHLTEEKDAFIASYGKVTARVDPNASLDQQFRDTVGAPL